MKRRLLGLIVLAAVSTVVLRYHPPARAVLDVYPPLRTAFENTFAAGEAGTDGNKTGEAAKAKAKRGGGGPAPVTVALVTLTEMPVILSAPGTVEAEASVGVRTRVDGQILEVLFKEGDLVKEGQILFRLDERLIQAQIKQAEANIKRDQANLQDALATLERRNTLVQKKIVSEAAMDTAKSTVAALRAAIAAGQAALEAQRTQLDYLTIKAPITGRTGSTQAKPGSNVRAADTTPLVVINQITPISVSFALPQRALIALRAALAKGAEADVTIPGPTPVVRTGKLDFLDNQVDKQTGTLTAKLQVPNTDEALWPGLAVEVALRVEMRRDVLTVPATAVLPAQQGMIVWVVGSDGRVRPQTVELDRVIGQTAYLTGGVKPGDTVVTDGHVRLAPGMPVTVRDPSRPAPSPGTKGGAGKEDARGEGKSGRPKQPPS